MGIVHSIPSSKRRPGTFAQFDDTSGSRQLIPTTRRLLLIGMWNGAGDGRAVVNVPIQVADGENDADNLFGKGSELALMVRAALSTIAKLGNAPEIWGAGIAEPGAGTAETQTFTVTGTATASGDIIVEINGVRIRCSVANGDVQNTIAANLKTAIEKYLEKIPVTVGVAINVVTATHRHKGVYGNDTTFRVVQTVAGVTVATAQGVAGAGAADPTTALDNAFSRDYLAVAIGNHTATDVTTLKTHMDAAWDAGRKRWRHAFVGEKSATASTHTTLAAGGNYKQIVIAGLGGGKELCGQIAARVAAASLTQEKPNFNWDGTVVGGPAPEAADVWIDTEVETLLAGGVTPLTVNDEGEVMIERLVTTKTTVSSVPFESLLDLANSKTSYHLALQVDARVKRMIAGQNLDDDFLTDIRAAVKDVLKKAEELGWVHKVDEHEDELIVEKDAVVPTRAVIAIPESVVPNAHQVVTKHILFVE